MGKNTTNMENHRFSRKPEISISMAGATFLDKNVQKSELLNVVYGCLDVNFADAGHGNCSSLHTYMDPCRFRDRRFFHVCFLFRALHRGNGLWVHRGFEKNTFFLPPKIHTHENNYIVLAYTYIHIHSISRCVFPGVYFQVCNG